MLYPLKFKPIFKEKIWGGNNLNTLLNKDTNNIDNVGESWELSAVQDNLSIVSNGSLADNNIQEVIEIYMGELVGDHVYEKFGIEFPILFKFIDAREKLSIQVHPDNNFAKEKHHAYGKTEMWYIISAKERSELVLGLKEGVEKKEFLQALENNQIESIINFSNPKNDDVYFIPAGTVHSIGSGILLAEIQQTSDISYRIHDYNRTDDNGELRDLHNDLAKDSINYKFEKTYKVNHKDQDNIPSRITKCEFFTSQIISFDKEIERDYYNLDSFVVYMCLEGDFYINYNNGESLNVKKGETVLIPAVLDFITLYPSVKSRIIETYIE